jgi:hypothetical protein
MKRVIALGMLVLMRDYSEAGTFSYECTVQQYAVLDTVVSEPHELSPDGPLVLSGGNKGSDAARTIANAIGELYIGQRFQVDRKSGVVLGKAFAFNAAAKERKVVDEGSDKQAFKLLTMSHPPFISWQTLTVAEHSAGSAKPFLMVHDTEILAGTCE